MTPAEDSRPPIAGRYRMLRRLGAGGVAAVFLAEDERLGRQVAIKRLHADSPAEMARRFEREARLGAALNHPNLVAIYDVATDASDLLIVMEYVEGSTLAGALRDGPLPPERALEVLRGMASALDHAHSQGVVHRDVKPANVLLGSDGRVKLADLGIARAAAMTDITGTGVALGTPAYMAPEQLGGGAIGPAADVYALAAVAFEALTGSPAHTGRSPIEIAHRVTSEPAVDVREAWPDAPAGLADALRRGMAADPNERPASAGALVTSIDAALATAAAPTEPAAPVAPAAPGTPTRPSAPTAAPAPPPTGASSRRRAGLAGAAALIVAAAVVALLLVSGGEPAPQEPSAAAPQEEQPAPKPEPTPDETVVDFYEQSADGDTRGAWELASPSFREQLGGYAAFEESQSTLESIEFDQAETVDESGGSAEVAIQTVATHTDRTDECEGSLDLTRGGDAWLIDQASITCS
jgi:serine/threonine-protein kinase